MSKNFGGDGGRNEFETRSRISENFDWGREKLALSGYQLRGQQQISERNAAVQTPEFRGRSCNRRERFGRTGAKGDAGTEEENEKEVIRAAVEHLTCAS